MWYVIQTTTGSEEALVCMIKEMISEDFYMECFYIKRECTRKEGDGWQIHLAAMFPGYLFVDTDKPKEMYMELKGVPKLTKLLKDISGGIGGRAAFPGRNPGQTACGEKIPCAAGC